MRYDVAVVGAGIVGLAHAWMAAARGMSVLLIERSAVAQGASIRNFGMVWPIGQPAGEAQRIAMRSRALWMHLAREANIWVNECGSLHLAHRPDEMAVLEEYAELHESVSILSKSETLARTPAARSDGLLGSMWSASEICVNPVRTIAAIPKWLQAAYQVQCEFSTTVCEIDGDTLVATNGKSWSANRIVVCSGSDFQTLLPDAFAKSELRLCKLHMMCTHPQPSDFRIGPHLASGLTLRHYSSFASCPSLANLISRVQAETPELNRFGIHVMASQNETGRVILGDSHEYDDDISPLDRAEIDVIILRELLKQFHLPDWTIERRWTGIYAKHPSQLIYVHEPSPGVHVCVGPGGAGMTMSFGLADKFWTQLTNQELHA